MMMIKTKCNILAEDDELKNINLMFVFIGFLN